MNIILIGYRASGKTTLGKMLAEHLGKPFVDVDVEICKRFDNKTIAEIWAQDGEPAFREVEVEVTREVCQIKQTVIGLAGGSLMRPKARQAVERAPDSVRIYLKCKPDVLHERINKDRSSAAKRPALTTMGGGIDEIESVLAEREPVYEAVADHVLDLTNLNPEEGLRRLMKVCKIE